MKKNSTTILFFLVIFAFFLPGNGYAEEYLPESFPDTPFLGFEQQHQNSSPPILAVAHLIFKEFRALRPIHDALKKTEKLIDKTARKAKLKGDIYLNDSSYQDNNNLKLSPTGKPFPISWNSNFRPDRNSIILKVKSGEHFQLEGEAGEDGYLTKFMFRYQF
jgi:hypothetical protein